MDNISLTTDNDIKIKNFSQKNSLDISSKKPDAKDIENNNFKSYNNEENGYDERVNKLISTVNEKFKIVNREFSYSLHEKTNRYIVTVKNSETGDVIKEIPSEQSLDLFAKMLEMAGLIIDEKS